MKPKSFDSGVFSIGPIRAQGSGLTGVDNSPSEINFGGLVGNVDAIFGSLGFRGSDLAWLSSTGSARQAATVFVDEAGSLSEDAHVREDLSLLAFHIPPPPPPPPPPAPAPEPASVLLLLTGLLSLVHVHRRKATIRV